MNNIAYILSCIILLAIQQRVTGLSCYICNAGTDGCGMKFSSTGSGAWTVSSSNYVACQKTVYDSNTNSMYRTFSANCTAGSTTNAAGAAITTYCCTTDLCNGVQPARANLVLGTLATAISLLLLN